MTTLREAAQQALEALERYGGVDQRACDAEEALRAALAQEQAEPVQPLFNVTVVDDAHPNGIPLEQWVRSGSPPQCKPLTEEESDNIYREYMLYQDRLTPSVLQRVVRAVERAHGIGA